MNVGRNVGLTWWNCTGLNPLEIDGIRVGRNAGDQSPRAKKIPRRGTRDGLNTIVYANLCLRKHLALIPDVLGEDRVDWGEMQVPAIDLPK
jgi:hypothetical protein